jgi:hypothetical protein
MAGSGDGPEFRDCIDLAERLGRKVTNHGYVTHRRLSELMKMSHVQVLPSFFEGLPLVLFEGLASGCRIITTNLSGFKEIFGKAKSDVINLIQLPPLETIDRPYRKDETQLETALCKSILDMIAAVKNLRILMILRPNKLHLIIPGHVFLNVQYPSTMMLLNSKLNPTCALEKRALSSILSNQFDNHQGHVVFSFRSVSKTINLIENGCHYFAGGGF